MTTNPQQQNLMDAYKQVFLGSPQGYLVLMDLINMTGVFRCNTKDPHSAAVLEGKRAIGINIFHMTGLSPGHGNAIEPVHLADIVKVFEGAHNYKQIVTQRTKQEGIDDE